MIPDKIARFMTEQANVGAFGTRSAALVPHVHRISNWHLGSDGRSLTVCLPALFQMHLLESLQDNGRVAVTLEQFPSHETYQFKGRFLRHRDVTPEERAAHARGRDRFARDVFPVFPDLPRQAVHDFVLAPDLAVECVIDEVFLQTPGPRAGTRLVPPMAEAPAATAVTSAPERTPAPTDARLPDAILPVLDNGIPCIMVTCARDGTPNVTIISQVYPVDRMHVALSFQFFNKTVRNVRENPRAEVCLSDIMGRSNWVLALEYARSESHGPVFEAMELQIEAIASATGMAGIFKLLAADIYRIHEVRALPYGGTVR